MRSCWAQKWLSPSNQIDSALLLFQGARNYQGFWKSRLDTPDYYCICHPGLPSGGELLN